MAASDMRTNPEAGEEGGHNKLYCQNGCIFIDTGFSVI